MKLARIVALLCAVAMCAESYVSASGPLGVYGIVERVVFEPNRTSPERVQVWGAFAYVDSGIERMVDNGCSGRALCVSSAASGYMYFKLPAIVPGFVEQPQVDLVKREWADLESVAGTGQAVGFGTWGYIGGFQNLRPDVRLPNSGGPPYILERVPQGGASTDMRVRPANEPPASPATYQTNAGVMKLDGQGSHAAVIQQLRDALR